MKRLQIYIPHEMDAALGVEAVRTNRSKADLIREYVGERLPESESASTDSVEELIGMFEGQADDSASVDHVVYGT